MAKDKFHEEVRAALESEGWLITDDPLSFKIGKVQVQMDLGAERLIAAERGNEKVAIEIKTFSNLSFITALYEAVGKYIIYRNVLKVRDPERALYLAIPEVIYKRFFEEEIVEKVMEDESFKMVIYNQHTKVISQWIK